MSTVVITVKTPKSHTEYNKAGSKNLNVAKLINLLSGLNVGALTGEIHVSGSTSNPVSASGTVTVASIQADDTITIGKTTLTGKASPSGENQFDSDGTNTVVAAAIVAKINAHSVLSTIVKATSSGAVITVTANQKGLVGNYIVLSSSDGTRLAVTGSGYLISGTGGSSVAPVQVR